MAPGTGLVVVLIDSETSLSIFLKTAIESRFAFNRKIMRHHLSMIASSGAVSALKRERERERRARIESKVREEEEDVPHTPRGIVT